ncbi:MAG: serine O-acetyltransferase [Atopobiaceae bacterium]|nr:serine O-acetyltransferase [Atopobiaceae bacterium]
MKLFELMREDMQAAFERDPAAEKVSDIVLYSVGTHAVWAYRWHHWLYEHGLKHLALWLSKRTRTKLGVDIHPAATIGRRFTIDHGMGVVIGSTAIIGDDCMVYQGVTLGMTGKRPYGKRHPTLGSNVLVGANAVVLGAINVGDGAKIGAGAVVVEDVPEQVTVAGVPARIVRDRRHAGFRLIEPASLAHEPEEVRWSCAL